MNSQLQSGLNTSTDHNNHYSARITCLCDSKSLARLDFHQLFTNLRFVQSIVSQTTTLIRLPCWTCELPLQHTNNGSSSQDYIYTYCRQLMATTRADPTTGQLLPSLSANALNLLTIPFEVRCNILRHLLYRPEGISWHDQEEGIGHPGEPARCIKLSHLDLHPQILRVNSQLLNEGSSILYKENDVIKHFYHVRGRVASASENARFVRKYVGSEKEWQRLRGDEYITDCDSLKLVEEALVCHEEEEQKENIMKSRVSQAEAKVPNVVLAYYFEHTRLNRNFWLGSWLRIAEVQGVESKNLTIDIYVRPLEQATIDMNSVEVLHVLSYLSTLREVRCKPVKVLFNGAEVKPDWAQEMVGSGEASATEKD